MLREVKPPFAVEYHHDPKLRFKFHQKTTDDEWLSKIGAVNWFAFSHDRKWHHELPAIAAIKQHKIGCFYLWGSNNSPWDKIRSFMRAYDRIEQIVRTEGKPYIYDVARIGTLTRVPIPE